MMQSQKLKKNTFLKIGTFVFSFFILFFSLYSRSYEIQFHTIRLHSKLDYGFLNQLGVSKIIYRVFQDEENGGGLYFLNSQFFTLEPALERLIEEFDFGKMKLCAWMMTRKFKWITDVRLEDYQYENGVRCPIKKLDIFNPDAVDKIVSAYKELAAHKIDSILIQDDLILRYNEGFSNWGKARFAMDSKLPPVEALMIKRDTQFNLAWNRIKTEQVNKMLALIVKQCKAVNPSIKIGVNVYYEAPVFETRAEAWYGHNLKEIANSGVDYIYLMSYQRQIKDEMNLSESANRALFKEIVETAYGICKEKLVVKIQLRDWKTSERIPAEEIREYLSLVPAGVERVCFTPMTPNDFDYLSDILKGTLKK